MLHRRIVQFFIIYLLGIGLLFGRQAGPEAFRLRHPGARRGLADGSGRSSSRYLGDVLDTIAVAVIGQALSIMMAVLAWASAGRRATWFGSFVKVAAYNVQAYPIVAIAPIIFILLGDGFLTRLLIAAMICYFPLLLSVLGIMSEPMGYRAFLPGDRDGCDGSWKSRSGPSRTCTS
jgi:NitT/TauT family transport system permease protein